MPADIAIASFIRIDELTVVITAFGVHADINMRLVRLSGKLASAALAEF